MKTIRFFYLLCFLGVVKFAMLGSMVLITKWNTAKVEMSYDKSVAGTEEEIEEEIGGFYALLVEDELYTHFTFEFIQPKVFQRIPSFFFSYSDFIKGLTPPPPES